MQFIKSGPDIPNRLLEAHQEGRVVFFCGAGISYPAGLPDFKNLTIQLFKQFNKANTANRTAEQNQALKDRRYDTALYLLQKELVDGRAALRSKLSTQLTLKNITDSSLETHKALLTLAKSPQGMTRLVTTNFDRLFEHVLKNEGIALQTHTAPLIPAPKNSWDSLVYLHGLLPETTLDNPLNCQALNNLVITSADFGLAYLSEGWAARFVSQLFKKHTVCFVGYSLNDPALRYLVDALAIDDEDGEVRPEIFAFAGCSEKNKFQIKNDYESKNVTPILYIDKNDHSFLHQTLSAWALLYGEGRLGLESIIRQNAQYGPQGSTKEDDFVGRVLWALMEQSGTAAKLFASLVPAPPFAWIDVFAEKQYALCDLKRLGIHSNNTDKGIKKYSLLARPAQYHDALYMSVLSKDGAQTFSDRVMQHMERWLCRYLDEPKLLLWIAQSSGGISSSFKQSIQESLNRTARLETSQIEAEKEKFKELSEISAGCADAIPRQEMRRLWEQVLAGRLKQNFSMDWHDWQQQFKKTGLTTDLRLQLCELLSPRLNIEPRWNWNDDRDGDTTDSANSPKKATASIHKQITWDWALALDAYELTFVDASDSTERAQWQASLPILLDDIQRLLLNALHLMQDMGEVSGSHWKLPSVESHGQNIHHGSHSWVFLIELLRDAWLETKLVNPSRAKTLALSWWDIPFPAFKRLALFAAAQDEGLEGQPWICWLLSEDGLWLQQSETKRERMRLFVLQAKKANTAQLRELENALLKPICRSIFKHDIKDSDYESIVEREQWLHLSKLVSGGVTLGSIAGLTLASLNEQHPKWKLSNNQSDEFGIWMSSSINPDPEEMDWFQAKKAPRDFKSLVSWLQKNPEVNHYYGDDWKDLVGSVNEADRDLAMKALVTIVEENGVWISERWETAFFAWSDKKLVKNSWVRMRTVFEQMPENIFTSLASPIANWVKNIANESDEFESDLIALCQRLLACTNTVGAIASDNNDAVMVAINHPVGKATEALIKIWFKRNPFNNQGLPDDIKPLLSSLCDATASQYLQAKVILAINLNALYLTDSMWTKQHLLPLFSWNRNEVQATQVWQGFLANSRVHLELMHIMKADFLAIVRHFEEIGEKSERYIGVLIFCALSHKKLFTKKELQAAITVLPSEAAHSIIFSLWLQISQARKGKRAIYWHEYIEPFWENCWPKTINDWKSERLTERLCQLLMDTEEAFPQALNTVKNWLQPINHTYSAIHQLNMSDVCKNYPKASLELLGAIVSEQTFMFSKEDFDSCLNKITKSDESIAHNMQFKRLKGLMPVN
jgi:hypothetical protein